MKEKPYLPILDRQSSVDDVEKYFSDTLELIREVINYGSNLIPRCFVSSNRTLRDIVILVSLLKQAVAMLDAIEISVSQGALYAAHVPARVLFEIYLYINWILQKDQERRARQYYVWHLRQERIWNLKVIPGSEEFENFKNIMHHFNLNISRSEFTEKQKAASKRNSQIEKLLSKDIYKKINAEFNNLKKKKKYDVPWYQPCGSRSIARMAKNLNLEAEYNMFYSPFSDVAHARAFSKQVGIEKGLITFKPIRSLEGIKAFILMVLSLTFRIYQRILAEYRPGELTNFSRKYIEEWRTRFLTIKDVTYKSIPKGPI